jgi:hypothetical protein
MMQKTIPHQDEDGFVKAKLNPNTDEYVVLYDGHESGMDTDHGRWSIFCAAHGSIHGETNRQRAIKLLNVPEKWCKACANIIEERTQTLTIKIKPQKSPENREKELRFWAKKAKNSPEKQALFEQMFGERPDAYW